MGKNPQFSRRAFIAGATTTLLLPSEVWSASSEPISLENDIDRFLSTLRRKGVISRDEETSWMVYDLLKKEELVSLNGDVPRQTASLVKPFAVLGFLHQIASGKLKMDYEREIVPESKYIYKLPNPATPRRIMEGTIQYSWNDFFNWTLEKVGGPEGLQHILNTHYPHIFQNTSVVEYVPTPQAPLYRPMKEYGRTYKNKASVNDYRRFLQALWNNELPHSQELKRLMALPNSDRLKVGVPEVPESTEVYDKQGTTAMAIGQIGILVLKKGAKKYPYAFAGVIEKRRRVEGLEKYRSWAFERANAIRSVSGKTCTFMKKRYNIQ